MKPFRSQGGSPLFSNRAGARRRGAFDGRRSASARRVVGGRLSRTERGCNDDDGERHVDAADRRRRPRLRAMMIPHHQGAIDMAAAELRYGRNERLRRIAQEIVVDQQQEIAAMRLALGESALASDPASPSRPDDETLRRESEMIRKLFAAAVAERGARRRRAVPRGPSSAAPPTRPTSRSAIATASMPPSNSPTPFR